MGKIWPPRLIASADILADGTIVRQQGIEQVTNPATGNYIITLTTSYDADKLDVSVAPKQSGAPSWGWAENDPVAGEILVAFEAPAGGAANAGFTLRVYHDG